MSKLGDLGMTFIGLVDDVAGGVGDNFEATSLNNLAQADQNKIQNAITIENHAAKKIRDKKIGDAIEKGVYVALTLTVLYILVAIAPKIKSLFK
jgi:hypothetical protein